MAVVVVNKFESVNVKVDHRQQLRAPVGLGHCLAQTVCQQHTVGERGQHIVMSDVLKLIFVFLAFGDVGNYTNKS